MENVKIVEMLFNQTGLSELAYENNELSFFNQDRDKCTTTSSRLKEIIFDKLGLYAYTGLGEDSTDVKWWTCKIKDIETYEANEIKAILNCISLETTRDKQLEDDILSEKED